MDLQKSVAIVTGAASGLGEATARRLARRGARIALVDRDAAKGEAIASELGGSAIFVETDVRSAGEVEAAVSAAAEMGPIRVAVNCAGVGTAARILGRDGAPHDLEMFRTLIDINLVGSFNVLRTAAAAMAKNDPLENNERGVVINTASVAAYEGQIGQIAYAASKGGIVAMTLPAARDLSQLGIRVLAIAPGIFDTPMLALLPEKIREGLAAGVPHPKTLGQPDQYAMLVESIVDNPYLNGECVRLDGGLRMQPK
ncbi:MAG: 3-hydroxyacyl-CoA dehydrogenase [Gemmatimonadetes bacterium]|nr:3-hydroxyacyl-CoA dehydrogenase [Gemmatimonadota bacterium]